MILVGSLLNRHVDEVVWLFGKGPGLDHFDQRKAGPLRITINEAAYHVANPTYCFSYDDPSVVGFAKNRPPGEFLVLPAHVVPLFFLNRGSRDNIVIYHKGQREFELLSRPTEEVARLNRLLGWKCTTHIALHFCKLIGAAGVVMVGIDGLGGYASCLPKGTAGPPWKYVSWRHRCEEMLQFMGIPYEFFEW